LKEACEREKEQHSIILNRSSEAKRKLPNELFSFVSSLLRLQIFGCSNFNLLLDPSSSSSSSGSEQNEDICKQFNIKYLFSDIYRCSKACSSMENLNLRAIKAANASRSCELAQEFKD
jgi:hypothetical protein